MSTDPFSIRRRLPVQRTWPRALALSLLVAGSLAPVWPLFVRSQHQQVVREEQEAAVLEARNEIEPARVALREELQRGSVLDMHNERPERFEPGELALHTRHTPPPPYTVAQLQLASWCDQWDGPGRTCEREGESLTKAEAAIILSAHEHGALPRWNDWTLLSLYGDKRDAEAALREAERALVAPVKPAAGAASRWGATVALMVFFSLVALRIWRHRPSIEVTVDQHGVRYGDTHIPASRILGSAVNSDTLEIRTTEGNQVLGPFQTSRPALQELAVHIRGVVLTPQQRADEERARREIERQHEALRMRLEDS